MSATRTRGGKHARFTLGGLRWACHSYKPHFRHHNPAYFESKCRASGGRLVWYRLMGGE